ncbi:MAG: helix-turn-helix domain-containing protein [Candidatus Omnitrophica bacterium]|nr:helix-turn-helix domain-containing protein [Candidatus Omnitrophota bacterium]
MSVGIKKESDERLRALLIETRKLRGLTQIELAERVGSTQSMISKTERGERRLDVMELAALCAALNTTLPEFTKNI